MSRPIEHRYQDPLETIWIAAAQKMGLRVVRHPDSYASTDGAGTLSLSDSAGMDPDDCCAQMIFHELCHSLVQGSHSFGWVDWGLDNVSDQDIEREHACVRLQAALLGPLGLRHTFAPTTDFRSYYDSLPEDPFEERDPSERESIVRGLAAWGRRHRRPWRQHLQEALSATHTLVRAVNGFVGKEGDPSSLLLRVEAPTPLHPSGLPKRASAASSGESDTCSHCAWSYEGGPGRKVVRCRQVEGARIDGGFSPCERFEAKLDCLTCGACCREAYDTVEVSARDPAKKRHLDLMVPRSGGYDMKREGARCACLQGGIPLSPASPAIAGGTGSAEEGQKLPPLCMPGGADFTCSIYESRPRTCREFTMESEHCLSARRAVGLSR